MALALLDTDDRITVTDAELGVRDADTETTYVVRPISVQDYRRLMKQYTTEIVNRRTHQKEPKIDGDALQDAVFDYVLVDWAGILWRGAPAPCVWEHKAQLDPARRSALLDVAGMNRVIGADAEKEGSFRGSSTVRGVVA